MGVVDASLARGVDRSFLRRGVLLPIGFVHAVSLPSYPSTPSDAWDQIQVGPDVRWIDPCAVSFRLFFSF